MEEEFWVGCIFQGVWLFWDSNMLILNSCGFISLGWVGCSGILFRAVPPFQAIVALGANTYTILSFDPFGIFFGQS